VSTETAPPAAPNGTIAKFGYPETLIAAYRHWMVLLRPQQATLGSLVLASTSTVTSFAALDQAAFTELKVVVGDIEGVLGGAFKFEKINYLMLMMVDPEVHYHVIPRYGAMKIFGDASFADHGWPALPDLGSANDLSESTRAELAAFLRGRWPSH